MLKIKPRLYQEKILSTAAKGNTLVVLPTGMGKTLIAVMLGLVRQKSGQVLFMSPTKPLVEQHARTIEDVAGVQPEVLNGSVKFEKRKGLWGSQWLVATPQTVQRDILRGVDLGNFSLLIFDEAHRATGDYAYTYIAKRYMESGGKPLILALTASPGSTPEKIGEIMENLAISNVEVRVEDDKDVKPYVKEKFINWVPVQLTRDYQERVLRVKESLRTPLRTLKVGGHLKSADLSLLKKRDLIRLNGTLSGDYEALSAMAGALKALHALELIETQGSHAYGAYLKKLQADKTKAAGELLKTLPAPPDEEHPKLTRLMGLLEKQPLPAIVFANYRNQVDHLVGHLNDKGIKAEKFIGQKNGMSQKDQKRIVKEFRSGEHEVLVATSVGEEGIDLPSVATLIFYEPVPSAIRHIQRRGRLRKGGKVFVLITKGTREGGYYYAARSRERKMVSLLKNIKPQTRKQATLEKFGGDERYIVVDDRETKIAKLLSCAKIQRIGIGDFIISDRVAVERKTAGDFVSSIVDGRLFDQAAKLKEAYEKPLIIVEGYELYSQRGVHPNAIMGALASLVLDWGVPVLFTKNCQETARLLEVIAKREWEKGKRPSIRVPKATTVPEYQEVMVSSLPGINAVLAKRLLGIFGSPIHIFDASLYELMGVEGIGEKKASEVRKVLDSKYAGEEEDNN